MRDWGNNEKGVKWRKWETEEMPINEVIQIIRDYKTKLLRYQAKWRVTQPCTEWMK